MSKNLIHSAILICVLGTTTAVCAMVWLMVTALPNLSPLGANIPGFTELVISFRHLVLLPAIAAVSFSLWVLVKRKTSTESVLLFSCGAFASTTLVVLPAVLAIYLHFLQLFEDQSSYAAREVAMPLIEDYDPTIRLD